MELAGLACAQTLATVYSKEKYPKVLVCCGPGNQGGDGLVAARHLGMLSELPTLASTLDLFRNVWLRANNIHAEGKSHSPIEVTVSRCNPPLTARLERHLSGQSIFFLLKQCLNGTGSACKNNASTWTSPLFRLQHPPRSCLASFSPRTLFWMPYSVFRSSRQCGHHSIML